jgi:hypothetical protein
LLRIQTVPPRHLRHVHTFKLSGVGSFAVLDGEMTNER